MSKASIPILQEQYKIAIHLYQHEDNLNWKKLNNLLYVNASFFAASGLIIRYAVSNEPPIFSPQILLEMVSLVGIIVATLFGTALFFGIRYMGLRKRAVVNIEEILVNNGGQYIVSPKIHEGKGYLDKSPTRWMLLLIPMLLFLFWLIVLLTILNL